MARKMSLEKFFNPKSVAIIGASKTKSKVGHELLKSIIDAGYDGEIFPVNPKVEEILNIKCYPDLLTLPHIPDLVVIVVPATTVPSIMQQCSKTGVKAVIIITAGFKEVGEDGRRLEQQVVQIAKRANIRIIGPNCLGVIVPGNKLNASFGGELPAPGGIGYLSQSGALLAAIVDMANAGEIGFSKLVSIGNKADVNELDIIKAFGEDHQTKVIAGYLENISDGNTFVNEAEKISAGKPILLLKSGTTDAGAKAASSHTGSLAGSEIAYEAGFERAGIIRCSSIQQQFDYAQAFAYQPLPKGNRVSVITNAGGAGIMAADAIEGEGLQFAKLSERTIEILSEKLPPAASLGNPVDILGDALADRYEFALKHILEDDNTDIVLILLTPQAMTNAKSIAESIVKIAGKTPQKPIITCFIGAGKVAEGVKVLRNGKIPHYDCPEAAVDTILVMTEYVRWLARPKRVVKLFPVNRRKVEKIVEKHLRRSVREIGETEAKEILDAYGFVTPKGSVATTPEQAVSIAKQISYPVVLKIWSPDIFHKSDVGGVKVGLNNDEQVMDAFDLMMYRVGRREPDANILGVLVEHMVTSGREVILGMHRDPHFGPLMMFGMGGIMVEALKDVSFHLAPLTAEEAKQMLVDTKTYKILTGVRGQESVDIDSIAEGLQRLSQLVTEFPQIQELDINPYVVGPQGGTTIAVDARMVVEKK